MTQLSRRSLGVAATATVMSAVIAGCSSVDPNAKAPANNASDGGTSGGPSASTDATSSSPTPVAKPVATLSTAHGLTGMLPTDALKVTVANGTLDGVTVTTAKGTKVPGAVAGDSWKPTRNLLPQTSYVATVAMKASDGTASTQTAKFSTLQTNVAGFDILYTGFTLGVGMPAIIQFVTSVETPAMRAEVQKHVSINVSPAQEGSWGWLDDRQLLWRPKNYWKPGTKITVTANLAGIQTGKNKWIGRDATGSFSIGDARISYVNIATHQMRVTENGKTVRTIPVTTGKQPSYTTRSGTKVIMERDSSVIMDSTTVDIPKNSPDAYHLNVKWAMRLTWSGEFIHAAPWSVGSQGYANVSHGCTGMSTSNAKWMFDFSRVGDVVIYTGSNREMTATNGYGMWNMSWSQWKSASAL